MASAIERRYGDETFKAYHVRNDEHLRVDLAGRTLCPLGHGGRRPREIREGGIGVIPVSCAAGVQNAGGTFPNVNRNVVRGVNPAGQI